MSQLLSALLLFFSVLFSSQLMAQVSLRADVYKALDEAKVAQEEGRLDDAFTILNKLKARSGKKSLMPYEVIQLHNFYAYAWLAKEDYQKALAEFSIVLQQDKVPEAIVYQTRVIMARLYLSIEQPDQSIGMLKEWLENTEKPTPDAYVLMSQAYLQKKDIDEALQPLLYAFKLAKAQGRKEKDSWYKLLQYIYNDKKDFKNNEKIIEILVNQRSKAEYFPVLKVQPLYPKRAQLRGIEGYCIVEYTVTKTGTTKDASAADCSSLLFESESIQAALKFKYKPRVIDGEAVEVPNVKNKFNFKLQ